MNQVCRIEPPHTHFNSKRQKIYKIIVSDFLLAVSNSLLSHGFDIGELDRITQWRLEQPDEGTFIEKSLSRDKADRLYTKMKKQGLRVHCLRELCSNLYTVLAYKDETSQTRPQGTKTPADGQRAEGGQELATETPSNTNGKRGRPVKEFEEFFIDPNDADKIIPILKTLLKGKIGRDAARVIVACYHGRWITEPTVPSIERKFGIGASGLKEPLRCHFHHGEIQEPKFPKFTDEELTLLVEKIRQELEKQPK